MKHFDQNLSFGTYTRYDFLTFVEVIAKNINYAEFLMYYCKFFFYNYCCQTKMLWNETTCINIENR